MAEEKKLSEKLEKIISEVEKLSVLELADLVKALEEKFGVSAQPVVASAPSVSNGGNVSGEAEAPEAKTAFTVILKDAGQSKIQVIKVLREVVGMGLKEAKELTDSVPKPVKENVSQKEAEELKKKLEEAGAIIEVK